MEPWRAVNAHDGGMEAQNGALYVLYRDHGRIFSSLDGEQDPDPH
jgi:hypothetical protein